ncbi:AraC family transcriptional regulator [Runella sp. SP2]|uniref:AraC family transcriptional regulator n=1 Tax=Runella sp. SP2 TaxID=2268026 RepID=UPI000F0973F9|nr:AraC family transcriptional regulator [Runella sp. SP2]AYQ35838.1 AraC family transcriptional regulator [Runella sp. SP2]
MKALLFRVPTVDDRSFRVQVDEGAHFYERLHFHPEFQLTLILEGTGTLVVGDRIDRFQPLDLLLLGADVPHVLLSDPAYFERNAQLQIKACTFFFREEFFLQFFEKTPELRHIHAILQDARRGVRLRFGQPTDVTNQFEQIAQKRSFEQFTALLTFLDFLTLSQDYELLAGASYRKPKQPVDQQRLENVFNFILGHYADPITLEDVANVANLTSPAFCRFLRTHTRKTFSELLSEVRIEHACRLLKDSTKSVSEIAFECGYSNLSNFNRQFKQITKLTPREYVKSAGELGQ